MKQKKLVAEIKEEIQFEENQKNLKEKHHIEDPNVVVIEKNNFIKFFHSDRSKNFANDCNHRAAFFFRNWISHFSLPFSSIGSASDR